MLLLDIQYASGYFACIYNAKIVSKIFDDLDLQGTLWRRRQASLPVGSLCTIPLWILEKSSRYLRWVCLSTNDGLSQSGSFSLCQDTGRLLDFKAYGLAF